MDVAINPPQITLALFAYNQERFICAAVASAFAQTQSPLEIIPSDDGSLDGIFASMQDMAAAYTGPHRLILRQNEPNLGLIAHVNTVCALASSDYIVGMAGSDISEPNGVASICAVLGAQPLLIHSGVTFIDETGATIKVRPPTEDLRNNDLHRIARSRSLYIGATGVWHKDLFQLFGDITETEAYEDLVLGCRAALLVRVKYLPEALVRYRLGSGISTGDQTSRLAQIRTTRANLAALRQRWMVTRRTAAERTDLLKLMERQISVRQSLPIVPLRSSRPARTPSRGNLRASEPSPASRLCALPNIWVAPSGDDGLATTAGAGSRAR
jgi:hypothetical protein